MGTSGRAGERCPGTAAGYCPGDVSQAEGVGRGCLDQVGDPGPVAAGVGELAGAKGEVGELDESVGAALGRRALVLRTVRRHQGVERNSQGSAVLRGEQTVEVPGVAERAHQGQVALLLHVVGIGGHRILVVAGLKPLCGGSQLGGPRTGGELGEGVIGAGEDLGRHSQCSVADGGDVIDADLAGGEQAAELGKPVGGAGGDHDAAGGGRVEVGMGREESSGGGAAVGRSEGLVVERGDLGEHVGVELAKPASAPPAP